MKAHRVNSVPPENASPAAPDHQEPGRPANGDWEMTAPITDHVLTGTHGTGALALSACALAGQPSPAP